MTPALAADCRETLVTASEPSDDWSKLFTPRHLEVLGMLNEAFDRACGVESSQTTSDAA